MFRSNPEMIRHYFNELLSDGQEHSLGEVKEYIMNACEGKSVTGDTLTIPTITSTVHAMVRENYPDLLQTRRGHYMKQPISEEATAVKTMLQRAKNVLQETQSKLTKVYSVDLRLPYFFENLPQMQAHARHLRDAVRAAIEYIDSELEQLPRESIRQEDNEEEQAPTQGM